MTAAGQFWGTLTPTLLNGLPPQPAQLHQPNQAAAGEFLLNIDAHRPDRLGCFIYRMQAGTSPIEENAKFVLDFRVTTNDGTRLVAHATEAYTLENGTGRIQPVTVPARNNIPYRLDITAVAVVQNASYQGTWRDSWGDEGTVSFWRPEAGERVRDVTTCRNWSEYKQWASEGGRNNFAFRGQSNSQWQMKTSLHRSYRFDLWHYSNVALPYLQQELEGAAGAAFNRENPADFARLLALAHITVFQLPCWTSHSRPTSPHISLCLAHSTGRKQSARLSYVSMRSTRHLERARINRSFQ